MDDIDLQKLVIVAQYSPTHAHSKRRDRTGNFMSRPKMTVELAQSINDGLYFFEQVCLFKLLQLYNYGGHVNDRFSHLLGHATEQW